MSAPKRNWWAVVVFAVGACSSARADPITPDSIASPPAVSPTIQGGSVAPGGWVADQYQGAGVVFPGQMTGVDTGFGTAVIRVNGASVWTPAAYSDGLILSALAFNSPAGVAADLVLPGTSTPAVADSVRVDFLSAGNLIVTLGAYDKNGVQVASTTALIAAGVETPLSLGGAGIESIRATAYQPVIDPLTCVSPDSTPAIPVAWGVRSIEWANAPEPGGLVLAGLGMCGLIGYARRRRARGVVTCGASAACMKTSLIVFPFDLFGSGGAARAPR